jgi:hypothetical protein
MSVVSVTYASSPSSDLFIPPLEFNNETAGVIRLAQSFGYFPTNQGGSSYVGRVRLSSFR